MHIDLDADRAKTIAKAIAKRARGDGAKIAHGQVLDGLAEGLGYRNWNTLAAQFETAAAAAPHTLYPADLSWLWSGADEPNGFGETVHVTERGADRLERLLNLFGEVTGQIDQVSVSLRPARADLPEGVPAALSPLKIALATAEVGDNENAVEAAHQDVAQTHGDPARKPGARTSTLVAYQLDPDKLGLGQSAYMDEVRVRLSDAERTHVQQVLNRLREPDLVGRTLFDVCVSRLPDVPEGGTPADTDGVAGAIALASDYIAQNCPGARIPEAMRQVFGAEVCPEAIELHAARWGA